MIERRLKSHLKQVAYRACWSRLWRNLFFIWAVSALTGAFILWYGEQTQQPALPWGIVLGSISLAAAIIGIWAAFDLYENDRDTARRIEKEYPELGAALSAAIEQRPELPDGNWGYMQEVVINDALEHGYLNHWGEAISSGKMRGFQVGHFLMLFIWGLVLIGMLSTGKAPEKSSPTVVAKTPQAQPQVYQMSVEPGNGEIEKGSSILFMVRFEGAVPPKATLVYQGESESVQRIPMTRNLDDLLFGYRLPEVSEAFSYHVELEEQHSEEFQISVYENPELVRADAELRFPKYTQMTEKIVEDTRKVTAVEGTELTLLFHLNKPVSTAKLAEGEEELTDLKVVSLGQNIYSTTFTLEKDRRLRLHLEDDDGHQNKHRPEFVVQMTPNMRPELKIAAPSRDTQVSPLEELLLKVNLWDDYGLSKYGLSYNLGGQTPQELMLGEALGAKERLEVSKSLDFESISAEPDQLLAYHFWAEDIGPDGKSRRTLSDMYFAEVRHFEEIFRQGEQPPGGASQQQQQEQQQAGQNAQQATKLAELQKQIIIATWKVIRREMNEKPSEIFKPDTKLIKDEQGAALEQAQALAEEVEDAESKSHLAEVRRQMAEAVLKLSQALDGTQPDLLFPAMVAEQAAYQALLKLRAREHRVTRGNQQQQGSSSGSSSGNRSQQQLQQLELSDDKNRYEQQRTATSSPQNQRQQEARQVSSRLRELAQRQSDLNKRLKELQSALEAAESEKEREEIERQLKRLRDQQQQILRDTDELKNRMERPENQDRMADAQQQLDQTRENVRRASEALKEGMVSAAAAAGARAEQKLNELHDDFRKQVSNRFSEEMQQMQAEAQELEQNQNELSQKLEDLDQAAGKSLRDTGNREKIEQGFEEQQEKLADLLDQMQHTVEESDSTEPLLSRQLYDSLRKAEQNKLKDMLELTQRLLESGFVKESQDTESRAGSGISRLRQDIENATESILGDQSEMLSRARDELEDLSKQLNREIDRFRPGARSDQSQDPNPKGNPSQQRQPGDQPSEDQENRQSGSSSQPSDNQQRPQSDNSSRPSENRQQPPAGNPSQGQGNSSSNSERPNQENSTPGSPQGNQSRSDSQQQGTQPEQRTGGGNPRSSLEQLMNESSSAGGPITGGQFLQWSDRLRDVEEMVDDPRMQGEVAAIRGRARKARLDLKRHSKEPDWEKLNDLVAKPLEELIDRISEKLLQQNSEKSLVPIDRDPVPSEFIDPVRLYYERLGGGK